MKVWIHINGVQEGPYELNELPLDRMTPETPVWYEGMSYWTPAGRASLTAALVNNRGGADMVFDSNNESSSFAAVNNPSVSQNGGYAQNNGYVGQNQAYNYAQNTNQVEERPSTYMVWSILLTVICCNPIGIVPIITGTMVNSKFRNFDFEGAKRMSETTAWWLMITIVTSLILAPFSMLMSI